MMFKRFSLQSRVEKQCEKEIQEFERDNPYLKTSDGKKIILWTIHNPISLDNIIMVEPRQAYFDHYYGSTGTISKEEYYRLDRLGESREGDYGSYPAKLATRIENLEGKQGKIERIKYIYFEYQKDRDNKGSGEFYNARIVGKRNRFEEVTLQPIIELKSACNGSYNDFKTLEEAHGYINEIKANSMNMRFEETWVK